MYSYSVVSAIALLLYLFFLISFLAAKKDETTWSFIGVLITMVVWAGGSFFMRLGIGPSVKFWFDISLLGIVLFPVAQMNFLRKFMGIKKKYHVHLWLCAVCVILMINLADGLFIKAPDTVTQGVRTAYVYDMSGWFLILMAVEAGIFIESVYMVYCNSRQNIFLWKQLQPIVVGVAGLALGHICIAFPLFKGFPIDICSGIFTAVCMYYALYKKRLFHFDLMVPKTSCYITSFILSILILYYFMPSYEESFKEALDVSSSQLIILVMFTVMAASGLIYFVFKIFRDAVFEKDEIRKSKSIGAFSKKMSYLMGTDDIIFELTHELKNITDAEDIYFFLKNENDDFELQQSGEGSSREKFIILKNDEIINKLESSGGCILREDCHYTLQSEKTVSGILINTIKNNVQCMAAVRDGDKYQGIIALFAKANRKKYTVSDLNYIMSLSAVASIAINNAGLYEKAYNESRKDYLTGIANRKSFYEALQKYYLNDKYKTVALIMVDIDDFKLYNQLYGSEAGDEALKKIADIIRQEVKKGCMTARYGGKEFAVILPEYTEEEAQEMAENISQKVRELNKTDGQYAMKILTVSCGIAMKESDVTDFHELINRANMAAYYAKQSGKNRIVIYTEGNEHQENNSDYELSRNMDKYSDYAATVYALTAAIDAKDHYTFSHSENVAYYAKELARAYGMNEEGINVAYEAGLLHDIGKIGIDENILNKPGKLTEEEYATMKKHVELSIGIIRHLPSLDYVIPAVIGHHERYDGKGYPRRMHDEEIPLIAKILCIADSFDAMVSERTYKKKIDVEKALAIIEEEAGGQFDPKLARIFIGLVKDGSIKIRKS